MDKILDLVYTPSSDTTPENFLVELENFLGKEIDEFGNNNGCMPAFVLLQSQMIFEVPSSSFRTLERNEIKGTSVCMRLVSYGSWSLKVLNDQIRENCKGCEPIKVSLSENKRFALFKVEEIE